MADADPLALCQRELAAIVAATETAVTDILGAIEALRDAPPAARAAAITEIVAACQYHDMVGQRVQRIKAALHELVAGGDAAAVLRDGAGPSAGAIDQDDIDALFNDAAEE
ncbi:MAG: hypothetical protein VX131_06420 [Pseudomonadota bacterium]|nr:hypothetical protein [Pseudomonadota bacterium]